MILWEENSHTFCKAERFLVLFENVIIENIKRTALNV